MKLAPGSDGRLGMGSFLYPVSAQAERNCSTCPSAENPLPLWPLWLSQASFHLIPYSVREVPWKLRLSPFCVSKGPLCPRANCAMQMPRYAWTVGRARIRKVSQELRLEARLESRCRVLPLGVTRHMRFKGEKESTNGIP